MSSTLTKNKRQAMFTYIQENLITCDIFYRGGQLKVDASKMFPSLEESSPIVGAYQNYLGGGMAGRIQAGASFTPDELKTKKERDMFHQLLEACKIYFYDINNGGGDDYMQEEVTGRNAGGYKKNQSMPSSGY